MDSLQQINEGAWLIRLPVPWELESVNAFLFRCQEGWLLLDCGLGDEATAEVFDQALAEIGIEWRAITKIVVSHMHPDHFGGAARARRLSGAPVYMNVVEAKLVSPRDPDEVFFEATENYMRRHGVPEDDITTLREQSKKFADTMERFVPDHGLDEGDVFEYVGGRLQAISAPGHSPALICFYDPANKTLFSTDAVLERITPNIGLHHFSDGNPLGQYFDSLAKLEALDVDLVVPGHGRPFEGLGDWIASTRRHHRKRCNRIVEVLGPGEMHGFDVAKAVWGAKRPLGQLRMALAEGLAHLVFQARSGEVDRIAKDDVDYWRLPAA